jgi:ubiquitin carboxyl-terminal hydrolase 25/28
VDELHNLFELLRTAPTKSVRPTNQLAELTLFSDALEADYRKKSISSPNGPPSLATILHGSDLPVFGPEGPPPSAPYHLSTTPIDEDIEMVDRPGDKSMDNGSDTSEATLVDMESSPPSYDDSVAKDNQVGFSSEKDTVVTTETIDITNQEDDAVMVNSEISTPATESILAPPEKPPPVPPRNKAGLSIQTDNNRSNNDMLSFGAQQDVTEVIGNVVWRLSCAIKPTSIDEVSGEQMDIIRDTFFGANAVYTQKTRNPERKVESWAQLIVFPHSSKPRDIYEALDVVFDEQTVDVENAMTPQYASITKLPPILQIHIQRTDYDPVRKIGFKNRNPVALPETIYMDRYMDSKDPDLLRRRREAWRWKAQLRNLEARQAALQDTEAKVTVPDALIETKLFVSKLQEAEIEGLEVDDTLPEAIEERIGEVAIELDNISSQIAILKQKLREQFTKLTKYEYKLQTVFIHRGESGGGHYWIYLYDFENDIWREYNDDHVSIIKDRNRIFNPEPGQTGTPYYLAYVRSADKQDLVDAVVREVKEVEMTDVTDLTNIAGVPDTWEDEAIAMNDDESMDTRHVEHVKPRPLLPRPTPQAWENQWDQSNLSELDANGKKW